MKKIILLLLLTCAQQTVWAQYKITETASTLKFTVKNLGFDVDGTFTGFEGSITFDPLNTALSNFDVTVNAATVNTGNSLRDEHLKGDGYFDVKDHPKIRLIATKVTSAKSGMYNFAGQLTIKGLSKQVSFPFSVNPVADGYTFKGVFKINRKDFGIGGTSTVGDEVQIFLNVTAKKQTSPKHEHKDQP